MAKKQPQRNLIAASLGIVITSAAQCTGLEKEGAAYVSDDGLLIPFASVKAVVGDLVYYADTMNLGTILASKDGGDRAGYLVDDGTEDGMRVIVHDASAVSIVTTPFAIDGDEAAADGEDGEGDDGYPEGEPESEPAPRSGRSSRSSREEPEDAPRGGRRGSRDDAGDDAPRGGRRGSRDDAGDDAPRGGRRGSRDDAGDDYQDDSRGSRGGRRGAPVDDGGDDYNDAPAPRGSRGGRRGDPVEDGAGDEPEDTGRGGRRSSREEPEDAPRGGGRRGATTFEF